jgi:hypothetical protein
MSARRLHVRRLTELLLCALLVACGLGLASPAGSASPVGRANADETLEICGQNPNNVFYESDAFGMTEEQTCGQANGAMITYASGGATSGADAYWETQAPAGLLIDQISVSGMSINGISSGTAYQAALNWGPNPNDGIWVGGSQTGYGPFNAGNAAGFPASYFAFRMICEQSSCPSGPSIRVGTVTMSVGETAGPSLSAGGLWSQSGWVRGTWPITVTGDSPSGVCSLSASISGDPDTANGSMPPNQTVYHQCNGSLQGSLNTAYATNGADTLTISDSDAAGLSNSASETVKVDNQTPSVSFSGPSTALSTAGTQYVTANVITGASGAYGAECSVDGGPQVFYAGASPQVPVIGIGDHTISCTGMSNAVNASGQRASSSPESTTLDIQQPTEEAISFSKLADALNCRTVVKRVRMLGKPHVIRRHGHKVRVVRRYHTVKRHVRRCKARTVKRRVLVVLKRDGKVVRRRGKIVRVKRTERIVVLPHHVHKTVRHIKHGHRTTVSGILLTSDGTPLAGQTITVIATPNDATPAWAPVSTAVTNADGYWIAKVPPGPSRLLEAVYAGSSTTASASSTPVKLMVPARLRITGHTGRVAWGKTAVFHGRVYGGYIPRAGINLRLSYAYKRSWATYGVKTHVGANGRFTTKFTFGPGDPREHLKIRFRFGTLPGGDYPWAHAESNIVAVRVGGHPRHHRHRHRHHRHRHHRK